MHVFKHIALQVAHIHNSGFCSNISLTTNRLTAVREQYRLCKIFATVGKKTVRCNFLGTVWKKG